MSSLDPPAKPGPVQSNVKPFTGFLPIPWENYILCLVFHLIVPLIPLVFERSFTGEVRPSSWLLVASCYLISLGVSSISRLYFGLTMVLGFLLAAVYGNQIGRELPVAGSGAAPVGTAPIGVLAAPRWIVLTLAGFALVHAFERYGRHVVRKKPYLAFMPGEEV